MISGMGVAAPGTSAQREVKPLDQETLFLPIGASLTDRLRAERPRMYERYLRIRSTATRLEYMRHPRPRNPKTIKETEEIHDRLGEISSPMLVIIGSLDGLVPNAQRLHQAVSHSSYVEIEDAPHNVYWEAAEEWNQAVASFLAGVR